MQVSTVALFLLSVLISNVVDGKVYQRAGMKVNVEDKNSGLSSDFVNKLVNVFFTVYPKEKQAYNPKAVNEVNFILDPDYNGVAESWGDNIRFSSKYFKARPKDLDVVTHEAMHVLQAGSNGPGWLIEGIADYGRHQFGVNNKAAGWALPSYEPNQKYTDAYKVTAAFLKFVEGKHKGTVKGLFTDMLSRQYTDDSWKRLTKGKSVDQLWSEYSKRR